MAGITLDRLYLHRADDLATYLAFYTSGRGDQRSLDGEVRAYANGRNRIITRAGTARSLPVTVRQATDADLDTLEEWRGELLMLRDHRGRLVYGTYFTLAVADYKDRSGYDVSLEFVESTHDFEAA